MKILTCENGHYLGRKKFFSFKEKFCPECGARVISKCPACGKPLRINMYVDYSRFCPYCGTPYDWLIETSCWLLDAKNERAMKVKNL